MDQILISLDTQIVPFTHTHFKIWIVTILYTYSCIPRTYLSLSFLLQPHFIRKPFMSLRLNSVPDIVLCAIVDEASFLQALEAPSTSTLIVHLLKLAPQFGSLVREDHGMSRYPTPPLAAFILLKPHGSEEEII